MFLEIPMLWETSAQAFSQAMAGNGTLLFNLLLRLRAPNFDLARLGVACIDSPPPKSRADVPTAEVLAAKDNARSVTALWRECLRQ
jgi:hypothetical protein